MSLKKSAILSTISTIIKVGSGFIVTKIIAIYSGPTGVAFVGQLQSMMSIIQSFASGSINTGVVKYTAEYSNDPLLQAKLWSTSLKISFWCTIPISFLLFIEAAPLSQYLFKSEEFSIVFVIFSLTLFFFVINNFLLSIVNGKLEIKSYTLINIIQSVIGLILTCIMTYVWGIKGALIAYTSIQSLVLFSTVFLITKKKWFNISFFFHAIDKELLVKLGHYSAMAITTALTYPIAQILLRNYIGEHLSWSQVGYWQGVTRISDAYLMIITTTLSMYYLPKLSSINEKSELRREIINGYKIIMPLTIGGAIAIYFLKEYIILLVYSSKFMPMKDLFFWQLIGDIIKIGSWLLGNLLLAKALSKAFIITEIVFTFLFFLLSIIFIDYFGLVGVTLAFALNYLIYWGVLFIILRNKI